MASADLCGTIPGVDVVNVDLCAQCRESMWSMQTCVRNSWDCCGPNADLRAQSLGSMWSMQTCVRNPWDRYVVNADFRAQSMGLMLFIVDSCA